MARASQDAQHKFEDRNNKTKETLRQSKIVIHKTSNQTTLTSTDQKIPRKYVSKNKLSLSKTDAHMLDLNPYETLEMEEEKAEEANEENSIRRMTQKNLKVTNKLNLWMLRVLRVKKCRRLLINEK